MRITTQMERSAWIFPIRMESSRIEIKDQGIGIPDVKKAMEPMFTTKPEEERTGMGFSFMEAFMDQVEVISKQGEGTTVIMTKKIGDQDKLNG